MVRTKIEKHYRLKARDIVDLMHDKGFFDKEVTRASMAQLQEYIAFVIQSSCNMAVKGNELLKSLNR